MGVRAFLDHARAVERRLPGYRELAMIVDGLAQMEERGADELYSSGAGLVAAGYRSASVQCYMMLADSFFSDEIVEKYLPSVRYNIIEGVMRLPGSGRSFPFSVHIDHRDPPNRWLISYRQDKQFVRIFGGTVEEDYVDFAVYESAIGDRHIRNTFFVYSHGVLKNRVSRTKIKSK